MKLSLMPRPAFRQMLMPYKNNVKSLYLNQQNALDQARLGQSAMSERGYAGMAGGALQTAGSLLGNSKLAGKMVDRLGSVWNK